MSPTEWQPAGGLPEGSPAGPTNWYLPQRERAAGAVQLESDDPVPGSLGDSRRRLLTRFTSARPDITAIIAPAGYGKSTMADLLARSVGLFCTCDAAGCRSLTEFCRRILSALARELPTQSRALAEAQLGLADADLVEATLGVWASVDVAVGFIIDNAEDLIDVDAVLRFLPKLFTRRSPMIRIIICSRRALPFPLSKFVMPHQVLRIGHDDLRLSEADIAALIAGRSSAEAAREVARVTQGWPVAALLLSRYADEGRLGETLKQLDAVAMGDLYDYLAREIIDSLEPEERRLLVICAAIPGAVLEDLALLGIENPAQRVAELTTSLPLVSASADGRIVIHPLLSQLISAREGGQWRSLVGEAARRWQASGNAVRAAQLYVTLGDLDAAARTLEQVPSFVFDENPIDCVDVLSAFDEAFLLRYPRLWLHVNPYRAVTLNVVTKLHQSEHVWFTLRAHEDRTVRYVALMHYSNALFKNARIEESYRVVFDYLQSEEDPQTRCLLLLSVALLKAQEGRFAEADTLRSQAARLMSPPPFVRAKMIADIDAERMLQQGQFEEALSLIEDALQTVQRMVIPSAISFMWLHAAFAGWLGGRQDVFESYIGRIERGLTPALEYYFRFFIDSARGVASTRLPTCLAASDRAVGLLLLCGETPDRAVLAATVENAYAEAVKSGIPFLRALAAAALFIVRGSSKRRELIETIESCANVESPALREGLQALADRSEPSGMFEWFAAKFTKNEARSHLRIELFSGRVLRGDTVLKLSMRELSLMMFLAVSRRPVHRAHLAATLWPEREPEDAVNNLQVTIHRLRRRLSDDRAVMATREGFQLDRRCVVDLFEAERIYLEARRKERRSNRDSDGLRILLDALGRGRPQVIVDLEWFVPVERRIGELTRDVGLLLGQDALARGRPEQAVDIAGRLIAADACDESAFDLLIRAHLSQNDSASALHAFQTYRKTLKADLDADPSPSLLNLIRGLKAKLEATA